MAIVSSNTKLIYFPVPKAGCTSLKVWFWSVAKDGAEEALPKSIHQISGFETKSWIRAQKELAAKSLREEGFEFFTVVRDPISRFISAWRNKATIQVFTRRGELEDLHNENLSINPSLGEFVDNFEQYRKVSRAVRVHTEQISWHLGPSKSAYQYIFRLEDSGSLERFLGERIGRPAPLWRNNSSDKEKERDEHLSICQVQRLHELLAPDYEWLDGLY